MDNLASKYIIFAFGLFITIIIITLLISTYDEVKGVYEGVSKTNISIKDLYDDIAIQYNDTRQNGVDLVNALKKYEGERYIEVIYPLKDDVITFSTNRMEREVDTVYRLLQQNNGIGSINTEFTYDRGVIFSCSYATPFDVKVEEDGNKTIINFEEVMP